MKSRYIAAVFFVIFALLCTTAIYSQTQSGDWIMSRSENSGKVHFSLVESRHGGHSEFGSDWPLSAFQGLDTRKPGRHQVRFTVSRDAGRFDCEGFLDNNEGAGLFDFFPSARYTQDMKSLGFDAVEEKQLAMAAQDVTVQFASQMKSEHLEGLDTAKLIAFRIFGVTTDFINDVRAAGLNTRDSDKLVAFRIHGVTPEMITRLRREGYSPDENKLIALRIHGATPEWMALISQRGYRHLELDKLIAFRIHGVTPELIDQLKELGYSHPEPDQLISMRIHGVTPDYIGSMRAQHGMKDLSIDQLVNLRIHGID